MEKIIEFIQEKWSIVLTILISLLVVLALLLFASISKNDHQPEPDESEFLEQLLAEQEKEAEQETGKEGIAQARQEEPADTTQEAKEIIVVDVKGAVKAPGVYQMESDNRVIDAIEMAGGFLSDSNQDLINLAQRLSDQMVIYVPKEGEDLVIIPNQSSNVSASDSAEASEKTKVNINTATKEELKTLHGIGDSKAASIISYREEHGSFQTIEELTNVSGIGDATFNKLKDFIEVTP